MTYLIHSQIHAKKDLTISYLLQIGGFSEFIPFGKTVDFAEIS